jgi:predicted small secreted protein
MRYAPILILSLLLAACGNDTRTAGGVTKVEAGALDDAAAMVEEQRLPADAAAASQAPAEPAKE